MYIANSQNIQKICLVHTFTSCTLSHSVARVVKLNDQVACDVRAPHATLHHALRNKRTKRLAAGLRKAQSMTRTVDDRRAGAFRRGLLRWRLQVCGAFAAFLNMHGLNFLQQLVKLGTHGVGVV